MFSGRYSLFTGVEEEFVRRLAVCFGYAPFSCWCILGHLHVPKAKKLNAGGGCSEKDESMNIE